MRSYVKVSLWVVVGFILIVPATYGVAAEPDPAAVQGHQGMVTCPAFFGPAEA